MTSENNAAFFSNNGSTQPSNLKEMMNTSAPICISSYIKGGQSKLNQKNGPRRQGNFYSGTQSGMG
jgi:hypothetical protein